MKIQVRLATIKDAQVIYDLLFQSSDKTNFLAVDSKEKIEYFNSNKELTKLELEVRSDNNRVIIFRDYLRSNVEARDNYMKLKKELAKKFERDGESYCNGKTKFIQKILKIQGGI